VLKTTMESPSDKQMSWRYAFAVVGVLVGLSIAIVFAIVFHNPDTAAWGLTSGTSLAGTRSSAVADRPRAMFHVIEYFA